MPLKDALLALVVIVAWGLNFVVIKVGLQEIPPFLLGALRFLLVAIFIPFFKRPAMPWRSLFYFGFTIGFLQFGLLFSAMSMGVSAAMASVILNAQAFFTVLIAAAVLGESVGRHNVIGMIVAAFGLMLIALGETSGHVTLIGFFLTVLASLSWAVANIVVKTVGKVDMLSLVIWGTIVSPLPFAVLSYFVEGPELILYSLQNMGLKGYGALIYLALISTTLGFGLWSWLLSRHPANRVAPLSLLVPFVGLTSATLLLDEHLTVLQWIGGLVILGGLALNVFGPQLLATLRRRA